MGQDRGWKAVGSVVVRLLSLRGWWAKENKSLEMKLQLSPLKEEISSALFLSHCAWM